MKKKQPTQKRKALTRWLWALALLVLTSLLLPVSWVPSQVLRHLESQSLTGPTEVIDWQKRGPDLFCLSSNEKALLLTHLTFQFPLGWSGFALPLDLTKEDEPAAALTVHVTMDEKNWSHTMVLGLVYLDEAASVRARNAQGWTAERDAHSVDEVWTGDILTTEEGLRYFWFGQDQDPAYSAFQFDTLDVLDQEGRVLYTYDLHKNRAGFSS